MAKAGIGHLVALAAACLFAVDAWAQEQDGEIYKLRPAVDLAVLAAATTVSSAWMLREDSSPAYCAPDCRPFKHRVNSFDRLAAGNWDRRWSDAGDAAVYTAFAGVALTLALDGGGLPGALEELVIGTQAVVVANALSVLAQAAADRPRPYMYTLESPLDKREGGDSDMSFHSGHVASTFAAAIVMYDALRRRHPGGHAWIALAAGLGTGAFVGTARALAGQHFPTDVMLSAILGTACGVLATQWHALPVSVSTEGAALTLAF